MSQNQFPKRTNLKTKSFRLDERVQEAFIDHCHRCGFIQERTIEALMVYVMVELNAEKLGRIMDVAQDWIDEQDEANKPSSQF